MGKTASKVFGLALNFRAVFLAIVAVALAYAMALLAVVYAYRKGYGIVGKPELGQQTLAKSFARVCCQGLFLAHTQRTMAAMVGTDR